MVHLIVVAGFAYVVGAFTPAVGRKIKSWFVTETQAVASKVDADAKKL